MQIVVKHDIIDGCMSGQDLGKIDLDKEIVYKKKKEFKLGFAAENRLKALQRRDLVKKEAITNFLDNVSSFVVAILKKMFEKLPVGSVVVCNASVFNPEAIFATKKDDLHRNRKLPLQHFVKVKVLTASHADKASIQYGEFLKNGTKLVNKNDDIDHQDDLLFTKLNVGKKYRELSKVLLSFLLLVMDKLIFRQRFPKIKLYCNKASRKIPFLVKQLSKTTC